MVIYHTNNTSQVDFIQCLMDMKGIVYSVEDTMTDEPYLEVDGFRLGYDDALKWIEGRGWAYDN